MGVNDNLDCYSSHPKHFVENYAYAVQSAFKLYKLWKILPNILQVDSAIW